MKPNGFSLSMNAKVEPDMANIIAWLGGNRPDIEFAMYFDRKLFEEANTFQVSYTSHFASVQVGAVSIHERDML